MATAPRTAIRFDSDGQQCAAWHHAGSNGACVVMAGGFAVDRGPGTDRFAARFAAAGFSVLAFDYRRLGDSNGEPRQVIRLADQRRDWQAALEVARGLPEVDPQRVAAWAFSVSGGLLLETASGNGAPAAVIAQTPNVDGPAATRNAARFTTRRALLTVTGLALLDLVGGWFGRATRLVPLVGAPGSPAVLSTPDAVSDTERALDPDGRYPEWIRAVAARSVPALGLYRPARRADRVSCPLLVVVADDDRTALAAPAVGVARRAPRGELLRLPGGHYAPFLDQHEAAVEAEIAFLRRHLT